jgi:predicted lipid-binding transport protein (Tim44 family)
MKVLISVFALVIAAFAFDADAARRLGGGSSVGKQSSNVTQREAQRGQQPAAPNQSQAAPAPANATPPVQQGPRWGGMLGGLAAGLGLAWLAHSLGLGEAFGQFLLIFLVVVLAMTVIGWVMRSRRKQQEASFAYAAGPAPADIARAPRQYSPDKVGNDASARPWERSSMAFDSAKYAPQGSGVRIGSALEGSQDWVIPAGFDAEGFIASAKRNFVTLQDAWDKADLATLRGMMTDEMLGEIRAQLTERERQYAGQPNHTEVVMLEAQLLGIEDLGGDYMASVEFSGMIREEPSSGPSPFREVWNMTKPKNGSSGWLVAGVQALQ